MNNFTILGLSPFERPDVNLALALQKIGVFSVLHLGRTKHECDGALEKMYERSTQPFGICVADNFTHTL